MKIKEDTYFCNHSLLRPIKNFHLSNLCHSIYECERYTFQDVIELYVIANNKYVCINKLICSYIKINPKNTYIPTYFLRRLIDIIQGVYIYLYKY